MSEYTDQAHKFMGKTGTTMKVKFLGFMPYFPDEKEKRDVYQIILRRVGRSFTFKFGQSINASKKGEEPNPYDVLACLTKYDPDTFENFCSEFGYDTDSRTAEKTFRAVQKEWGSVQRLFSDVLEELREIQ